jgi:hypothetical protein
MREVAKILGKLLADGELGTADSALLAEYRTPEVRQELDIWGEELGFSLVEIRKKVYLVPNSDSELLSFSMRDIRESESKNERMIDAFLRCYIIITILWMFYGGKNNNPKKFTFLQVRDIVGQLDERFLLADGLQAQILETEYEINFTQIASHWNSLLVDDPQKPKSKTRTEVVRRACRLLESQRLLIIVDEGHEIRPTDRLDDLMIGYYLDMHRVGDIHKIFDIMAEIGDAEAQQD